MAASRLRFLVIMAEQQSALYEEFVDKLHDTL